MAGQFTRLQKSYRIMDADGVALYTGVTYGANTDECKKPTADNAIPLGVVDNDERISDPYRAGGDQTGRQVAVKLEGIAMLKLAGAIGVGDRVILATGGTGKSVADASVVAGTKCNVIGFAEKAGVAGDVIPVRMAYHVFEK